MSMSRRDLTAWAKETCLGAIDAEIKKLEADPVNGFQDADERHALKKQRDRAAAFLGLAK